MVFEHIEKLKHEYTDKYVVVDHDRAELLRFRGLTGTVKTVNMSGRALVQFDGYNNIGWFDIDVDFLKVIDKPLETETQKSTKKAGGGSKPAKKKTPAKAAKAKGDAKAEMSIDDIMAAARGKSPSAGKPAKTGKPADKPADKPAEMSVADIMAAARGKSSTAPTPEATPVEKPATSATELGVAEILEAARHPQSETPLDVSAQLKAAQKPQGSGAEPAASDSAEASGPAKDPRSMSVAEMLAAARGKTATTGGSEASEEEPAAPAASDSAKASGPAKDPRSMSVAEMLAAARGESATADNPATLEAEAAESAPANNAQETSQPADASPSGGASQEESDRTIPTDVPGMIDYCRRVDAQSQ